MRRGLVDRHFRLAAPASPRPQVEAVRLAFGIGPDVIDRTERFDRDVRLKRIGDRLGDCPDGSGYEGREAFGRHIFRRPRLNALIARRLAAKIPLAAPIAGLIP
jgi:hypothetical protein